MKKLLFVIFSLQLLVVFTSCENEEKKQRKTLLENTWQVENAILLDDPLSFIEVKDEGFILEFQDNNRFVFSLKDSNSIFGKIRLVRKSAIHFEVESIQGAFNDKASNFCLRFLVDNKEIPYVILDGDVLNFMGNRMSMGLTKK